MNRRRDATDDADDDLREPVESDPTAHEAAPASEHDASRSRTQGEEIIDPPSTEPSSDPDD